MPEFSISSPGKSSALGKKFTLDFPQNAVSPNTLEDQIPSTTFIEGDKFQLTAATQSNTLIFLAAKNMKTPKSPVWIRIVIADHRGDTQLTRNLIFCRPPISTAIRGQNIKFSTLHQNYISST